MYIHEKHKRSRFLILNRAREAKSVNLLGECTSGSIARNKQFLMLVGNVDDKTG